jgi:hypothetical protein
MEAVKELWKRCKTYLKQLLCVHEAKFVGFDHHMSIMKEKCPKCGADHSYWLGEPPKKIQIEPSVTCHDL